MDTTARKILWDENGQIGCTLPGHAFSMKGVMQVDKSAATLTTKSTKAADTGNTFRQAGGGYIFNLATKGLSTGSWQIRIDLGDGELHTVLISLK